MNAQAGAKLRGLPLRRGMRVREFFPRDQAIGNGATVVEVDGTGIRVLPDGWSRTALWTAGDLVLDIDDPVNEGPILEAIGRSEDPAMRLQAACLVPLSGGRWRCFACGVNFDAASRAEALADAYAFSLSNPGRQTVCSPAPTPTQGLGRPVISAMHARTEREAETEAALLALAEAMAGPEGEGCMVCGGPPFAHRPGCQLRRAQDVGEGET